MEPHRVVETGGVATLGELGLGATRVRAHHGIGGQIVRQVGQPAAVDEGRSWVSWVAEILVHLEPPDRPPRTSAAGEVDVGIGHETAIERRPSTRSSRGRRAPAPPASPHSAHVGRSLGPLERRLEVEDRADRLAGDDAAGREAAPIADAVDLVADRLGVVAAPDEVGAQRVRRQLGFDRCGGGAQCLGDDLAPVQSAPRITRADADVRIGTMSFEVEHDRDSMNPTRSG